MGKTRPLGRGRKLNMKERGWVKGKSKTQMTEKNMEKGRSLGRGRSLIQKKVGGG